MSFSAFVDIYLRDKKPRLKYSTYLWKKHILETKILPYFGNRSLASIKASDVIQWQNVLLEQRDSDGNSYSQTYLRTIQNQLSAVLNHAKNYYDLPVNASAQAGKMGKSNAKEMSFWTQSEYLKFIETMKSKPISYYAFEMLYWTGIREGELLALTLSDFDFTNRKLIINKSYQRLKGQDYVTEPKTEQSNRVISLSGFLCEEMEVFLASLYGLKPDTRSIK